MNIEVACKQDFDDIWPVFEEIVRAGETYAFERNIERQQAYELWMEAPRQTYICREDGIMLGTYYIKSNQMGPGSHVCNCGYMVSPAARGKGIATKMCEHSQIMARHFGYKAMQFNSVVSTNTVAVNLWHRLGFETVGRLPKAYCHARLGYVDTLVMYKWLENGD
ncbi:N-acetyltransferase family protein [Gynuella sp.]|uniref:GNAT family N-acetyltransferase n=1 Tax=Gynuella sp. TaxID=2969146 RepID=UPI003D0E295F